MKINPRQMQKMMRHMGVQQEDIEATEVIIRCQDKDLIFSSPGVAKVNMMGQVSYQITGEPEEVPHDSTPDINEEDIQTIIDQTSKTPEEARKALEATKGDLAEAILNLQ